VQHSFCHCNDTTLSSGPFSFVRTLFGVSEGKDDVLFDSIHLPSIAAVIAVVAGAAMVFFGRRGAKA
jgi:hypothetical protein